jgi:hypothetical protein
MSEIPEHVRVYLEVVGHETERARALQAVFSTVNDAMPAGYSPGTHFGMPGGQELPALPVARRRGPRADRRHGAGGAGR